MHIALRLLCYVWFVLLYLVCAVHCETLRYNTIVCFGDSHSDTGNVYKLTDSKWPPDPPYYQGRFLNGKAWVERLGISNIMNYAYGSATTDNNFVTGVTQMNIIVPGIRQQINQHKNASDFTKINFDQTIYMMWAGVNDYFFNLTLSPSAVVESLMNSINDLVKLGAKHIIIVNQPPFQTYPAVLTLNMSTTLSWLTLTHNSNLSIAIQSVKLKFPNVSFDLLDIYSLLTNILTNTSNYSINSTMNCWLTVSNGTIVQLCTTPDSYIYIDEYHFTARIHQFIADNARHLLVTSIATKKSSLSIFIISLFIALLLSF